LEHEGRTALVTGAAGGLGVAESRALAGAGARVLMLDVRPDGERALAEVRAGLGRDAELHYVACDLADVRAAKTRVAELDARFGGIDILVNNAAVNPIKAIDAYDLDEYERVQAINATAALALSQAVVPSMKKKGWGQIIHITSITFNGGWSDFTAYVASKGTLLGLTRSMARELGRFNIRVNAVSPGAIPTALEKEVWADQLESYERFLIDHQSLKFRGSPEDIAEAILFLVSDRARFITGQNLTVDGGWWMH
jgi:3-oxoacyl-[acyl-carrier protein] reductase